jgi:O-antigen ligase
MESRAELYTVALQHFPDYFISGVGAGNYFNKWGIQNGFAIRSYKVGNIVVGVHNSFLQVVINWGLIGLLAFLAVIWRAYRCLPKKIYAKDDLALGILGISVALALWLLQSHNFYIKDFSLGLGILVGARYWIWPAGIVSAVEVKQGSLSDRNRPYCHSG